MLNLLLILLVLNFDALLCGLSLGVAAIRLRLSAALLIALLSSFAFAATLCFGNSLLGVLPIALLHRLGLLLLAGLTLLWICRFCGKKRTEKSLAGLWREPVGLDKNSDKYLSLREAMVLAFALAVDSLGGGLAFGLLGQDVWFWFCCSAVISFAMVTGANVIGREIRKCIFDTTK